MKICLASSAGGHLTELLQILPAVEGQNIFFLTFREKNTKTLAEKEKVYFVENTGRNLIKILKNIIQSFFLILRERPNVIITSGAGVVVAACFFGKIFGSKIVFIETMNRVTQPTLTSKIIYPISDLFIVQWKSMLSKYWHKAVYRGQLI